jgi:hypothetical protein
MTELIFKSTLSDKQSNLVIPDLYIEIKLAAGLECPGLNFVRLSYKHVYNNEDFDVLLPSSDSINILQQMSLQQMLITKRIQSTFNFDERD